MHKTFYAKNSICHSLHRIKNCTYNAFLWYTVQISFFKKLNPQNCGLLQFFKIEFDCNFYFVALYFHSQTSFDSNMASLCSTGNGVGALIHQTEILKARKFSWMWHMVLRDMSIINLTWNLKLTKVLSYTV